MSITPDLILPGTLPCPMADHRSDAPPQKESFFYFLFLRDGSVQCLSALIQFKNRINLLASIMEAE
jgi:hypothetical protein